jgi:hypothetical protein
VPTTPQEAPAYALHRKKISAADIVVGAKATGSVQCVPIADLIDGEKLSISDGVSAVDFIYDVSGGYVGPYDEENIRVDVSGAVTDQDVAIILRTVIDAMPDEYLVSSLGAPIAGLLLLSNDEIGAHGNVTITDTVADAAHIPLGMSGGITPTLPAEDVYAHNLAGYDLAHVQVIPTGGANPSIEVMFWSEAASMFVSAAPKLTTAGQGVDTPYEVTVPVAGRRMLVSITAIGAGSCDIYVAAFR